jgi:hypothetical protein
MSTKNSKPSSMSSKTESEHEITTRYINEMSDKEKVAFNIASEHLGSSFNLIKSIGFQKWLKKNNINI